MNAEKEEGCLMTVKERIIAIRLSEKTKQNPAFSDYVGVVVRVKPVKHNDQSHEQKQLKKCS